MLKFFGNLSKTTLVIIFLIVGTFLIILNDPPRTICDTQLELFKKEIGSLLFIQGKQYKGKLTKFEKQIDSCKFANSPGGCYPMFQSLSTVTHQLNSVPTECYAKVGAIKKVNEALWGGAELMVKLAWGQKAPVSYTQRQGWLNDSDLALFCKLKRALVKTSGKQKWNQFRDKLLTELPEASLLGRNIVWPKSLFSAKCDEYL